VWWAGKRSRRRTAQAYVGLHAVRMVHGEALVHAATTADRDETIQSLVDAIALLPRGTRLQVFVSGAICCPFLIPPVEGARDASDWAAIAASLVEVSTGLPSDSSVWMDEGQSAPRFAIAMHPTWLRDIERACGSMLESLRPWWALAVESVRINGDSRHGLAVFDSDELVLLAAEGETYVTAQTYALHDESSETLLRRALVTNDLSADALDVVRFIRDGQSDGPVNPALPFAQGEAG
jgi:hypothetical protein